MGGTLDAGWFESLVEMYSVRDPESVLNKLLTIRAHLDRVADSMRKRR